MLLTLLTWHVVATSALLGVYALVAGLQWSTARLSTRAGEVRLGPAPAVPASAARLDDEAVVLTGTA